MKTNLLGLSVEQLTKLAEIQTKRQELLAQLAVLDAEVGEIAGEVETSKPQWNPEGGSGHGGQRGEIKGAVVGALKAAGPAGLTVREIVQKTGIPRFTVDRWLFSVSAKNTAGLTKIGVAHYALLDPATEDLGTETEGLGAGKEEPPIPGRVENLAGRPRRTPIQGSRGQSTRKRSRGK